MWCIVMMFTKCEETKPRDNWGERWAEMDKDKIGKMLKKLRGSRPQKDIAEEVGVLQSTYSMYDSGQRIPSDEVKKKIANVFNVSVQEIFFS